MAKAVQQLPTVQFQSERELRAMSAHDLKVGVMELARQGLLLAQT